MLPTLSYSILPPWQDDASAADRLWRLVVAKLGQDCDELWLRFGNLDDMQRLLPPAQYQRLEELIGPHWGRPDPARANRPTPPPLVDFLPGIAEEFRRMGFDGSPPPWRQQPPKYAPYGCAVAPLTADLLHLLTSLAPMAPAAIRDVLSELADHWHFRRAGRDVIGTGDGMAGMGLTLTPGQAEAVRGALAEAGLDPDLLVER